MQTEKDGELEKEVRNQGGRTKEREHNGKEKQKSVLVDFLG